MAEYSRRTFVGASVAGLTAIGLPTALHAAAQCVAGPLPGFQPTWLSVDCASKRNFQTFRRNPDALGLAGVVSMSFVRGSQGTYPAGNLFLFPWLKPKGQGKNFPAVMPLNASQFVNATPIPNATLPLDEYFLRFVLKAPWASFIGFQVDNPYSASEAQARLVLERRQARRRQGRRHRLDQPQSQWSVVRRQHLDSRHRRVRREGMAEPRRRGAGAGRGRRVLRRRSIPMRRAYITAAAAAALLATGAPAGRPCGTRDGAVRMRCPPPA